MKGLTLHEAIGHLVPRALASDRITDIVSSGLAHVLAGSARIREAESTFQPSEKPPWNGSCCIGPVIFLGTLGAYSDQKFYYFIIGARGYDLNNKRLSAAQRISACSFAVIPYLSTKSSLEVVKKWSAATAKKIRGSQANP